MDLHCIILIYSGRQRVASFAPKKYELQSIRDVSEVGYRARDVAGFAYSDGCLVSSPVWNNSIGWKRRNLKLRDPTNI